MKKIYLLFIWLLTILVLPVFSQNGIVNVNYFLPAPGRHIYIECIGISQAAKKLAEDIGSMISPGSLSGRVVLNFNKAFVNHPDNPFGVDFTLLEMYFPVIKL